MGEVRAAGIEFEGGVGCMHERTGFGRWRVGKLSAHVMCAVPKQAPLRHARHVVTGEGPLGAASPAAAYETATEAPTTSRATTSRDASPAEMAEVSMGEVREGGDRNEIASLDPSEPTSSLDISNFNLWRTPQISISR